MARRKRPSQRRLDKQAERERRKQLRWAEEKKRDPERTKILFAEETTFGVSPLDPIVNVDIVLPTDPMTPEEVDAARTLFDTVQAGIGKPKAVKGPGDAQFTDQLNSNFEAMSEYMLAVDGTLKAHKEVILTLSKAIEEQQERIQDLEAAALGKPLEEIT